MANDSEPVTWRSEAIAEEAAAALGSLRDAALLENFYLAGGTGLARRFAHRLSRDLDFFSSAAFDEASLLQELRRLPGFSLTTTAPQTLHAIVPYPVLFPPAPYRKVAVADPRDIACTLPLNASGWRKCSAGSTKYAETHYSRLHILKSLTFFEDAAKEPMPHMPVPLEWDEVKGFFLRDVPPRLGIGISPG